LGYRDGARKARGIPASRPFDEPLLFAVRPDNGDSVAIGRTGSI
jgi:sec-independent protein translocase protein TatA